MHALYFGPSDAPLLGLYHPVAHARPRRGVLLCYPGPEEAMRVHWAYRNLTQLLLNSGFHVFRFDYYGTGDSSGPSGEGGLHRWSRDIQLAAQEFCALAAIDVMSLVGARLGGSMVATVQLDLSDVKVAHRLLWDPVINGADYLTQLEALQHQRIANSRYPLERLLDPQAAEALGYPLRPLVTSSIRQLDLLTQPLATAQRITVLTSTPSANGGLIHQLLNKYRSIEYTTVDEPCHWSTQEVLEQALLPTQIIRRIGDLVTQPSGDVL